MSDNTKGKKYYRSLLRNVVFTIIFTAITPTVVVSIFILDAFRVSHEEKIYDHFDVLTRKHQRSIDIFLEEKLMDIRLLARTNRFEELIDTAILNQRFNELQRSFDRSFVDLGVVNHEGQQIAYAGPLELTGVNYSDAEWFKQAISSPFFISNVFQGMRGAPHFIVSVRQDHGGNPWVLRATIDFGEFNHLVERLRIGETGAAFILDTAGRFQTRPDTNVDTESLVALFKKNGATDKASLITKKNSPTGTEVIYAMAPLKGGDWIMVIKQDAADAFSDLRNTQHIVILIIFSGTLAIIVTSLIVSNRLVKHISKADKEKQQAVKKEEMMSQQVIETGKLASIGELAAGIAHEINNPVAIMVEEAGWIQDLLEEEEFGESENLAEFTRALKQIKTQGNRCKEITHKLLSFARKTDTSSKEVDINKLIVDLVDLTKQKTKYNNVHININILDELPIINASSTELQQIFLNLVNNAIDAMDSTGGDVNITARLIEKKISIAISDSGPGIPRSNIDRIFDPFFTTKPVGKGTGLGLSICYGIIKKMGGDIGVESEVGAGTTFTVTLPTTLHGNSDLDGMKVF